MTIEQITDHAGQAIARLAHQFRKPQLEALVGIIGARAQGIEDAAWALIDGRTLQGAVGVTLDRIGEMVGVKRPHGMDDDTYRGRIVQVGIIVNTSHGTTETVYELLRLLGADRTSIWEPGGYVLLIQYQGNLLVDDAGLMGALIAATGPVSLSVSEVTERPFGFAEDPTAYGFDDGELARDVI